MDKSISDLSIIYVCMCVCMYVREKKKKSTNLNKITRIHMDFFPYAKSYIKIKNESDSSKVGINQSFKLYHQYAK